MRNLLSQNFLDDMNDSLLIKESLNEGFGECIDDLIEGTVEQVGLFESKEDAEWRKKFSKNDDDTEEMLDDGDMIDSLLN